MVEVHNKDYTYPHSVETFLDTTEVGVPDLDFDLSGRTTAQFQREGNKVVPAPVEVSHIVTSALGPYGESGDLHKPVIDFDIPIRAIPSSQEGHFHLYIDKEITWESYKKILDAFVDSGLVERVHAESSKSRGYSAVRLPWVKKVKKHED